jgi:hypothetical protein
MIVAVDERGTPKFDCQFLVKLARQGSDTALSRFDLAPGKFPFQRKRPVRPSLTHEQLRFPKQQSRDDLNNGRISRLETRTKRVYRQSGALC